MLYVKNTNSFRFSAKYDGVEFNFPVNERVPISNEAAGHIFGYGYDDKYTAMVRHGWCQSSDKIDDGYRVLNRFVFSEEEPAPTDPVAAETSSIPSFVGRNRKMESPKSNVE